MYSFSIFICFPIFPAALSLSSSFGPSTVDYFDELADLRLFQLAILSSCFLYLLSNFRVAIPLSTNRNNIPPLRSTNAASGRGDKHNN
jgi:hypothetical protein